MRGFYRCSFFLFLLLSLSEVLSAEEKYTAKTPVNLSIEPTASLSLAGSDVRLSFVKGKGAEQIITPSAISKIWINYSSVVVGNSTNSICVNLASRNLPAEVNIKLNIGEDVGAGSGKADHSHYLSTGNHYRHWQLLYWSGDK